MTALHIFGIHFFGRRKCTTTSPFVSEREGKGGSKRDREKERMERKDKEIDILGCF